MKKITFTLLMLFAAFIKADAQTHEIDTSKADVLRLDLKSARGTTVSDLFDEVKFLPLETTAESVFGTISQLEVSKDRYIIYDNDTKCILMFNLDGSFRTKIKLDKTNPAFAPELKLIENLADTCIRVQNGDYVFFYDLNGKLIKTEPKSVDEGKTAYRFATENIQVKTNYEIDNKFYEIALLKSGKEIVSYFPHAKNYTRIDQFMGNGKNITSSGIQNELFYKRYYDYNIYKITPNGLSLDYKLIFPREYSLPYDFLTNKTFKNKRIDFFQNNRKVFYGINNIYKIGDNLFFSVACLDLSKNHKRDFIFNLQSRRLVSLLDIEPDALSYYLPITNLGLNPDFFFHGFHLCKNDYLYNSIPYIDMVVLKDQNPNKQVQYDNALSDYFKTKNKKSNPVLVVLKPKKK